MCIIVYKPKGQKLPSKSILKTCFINNEDGAGFMFNDGHRVVIEKGFMNFNELFREITGYDYINKDLVIHFRLATHGSVIPQNCHPFPLSKSIRKLRAIDTTTKLGIAHNGIINFCQDFNNSLSDTQIFIKDYLSNIPISEIKNDDIFKPTYSKFALMDKESVWLYGANWINKDNIFYSNSTFETMRRRYAIAK